MNCCPGSGLSKLSSCIDVLYSAFSNIFSLHYRCHICREVFQLAAVLGNHLATAHPSEVNAAAALVEAAKAKNSAHVASKPVQQQQLSESSNSSPSGAAGSVRNKSVWCPVCNQGFTRQYNLKVNSLTYIYRFPPLLIFC